MDQIQNVMEFLKFGGFGRDSSTFGPHLIKQMNMNDRHHSSLERLIIDFSISQCEFRIKRSFINELKKSSKILEINNLI